MTSNDFTVAFVLLMLFVLTLVLINWSSGYTISKKDWKCIGEVQVGEDISNHECITYKKINKQ